METMHAFGFAMLGFGITVLWLFAIPFLFPGFSWDKHLFVKVKEPKYWESHKKEYLRKIKELEELLADRKSIYTSQTQMADSTISNLRDKVLKLSEDIGKKQFFIDNLKRENEELSEMIFQQLLEEEL